MAIEILMRIEGVVGGTRNYHYKGCADVLSWAWGLNRTHAPDGKGAPPVTRLNEITITKAVGKESPAMLALCAEGTRIKLVELNGVPVVGKRETQQKYLVIAMENVTIKSINTGGSTEDGFIREKIAFSFSEIKYDFFGDTPQNSSAGATEADCRSFAWGLSAAAAG